MAVRVNYTLKSFIKLTFEQAYYLNGSKKMADSMIVRMLPKKRNCLHSKAKQISPTGH